MKKRIILILVVVILLFGCGKKQNTLTCTNQFEQELYEEKISYEAKIEIEYEADEVKKATANMTFNNTTNATDLCSILSLVQTDDVLVECSGKKITITNYQKIETMEDGSVMTHTEFVKNLEEDGFVCK